MINSIASSPNFATTHALIAGLSEFDEFSIGQVEQLAEAACLNPQVRRIIADPDVFGFYSALYQNYHARMGEPHKTDLETLLSKQSEKKRINDMFYDIFG